MLSVHLVMLKIGCQSQEIEFGKQNQSPEHYYSSINIKVYTALQHKDI